MWPYQVVENQIGNEEVYVQKQDHCRMFFYHCLKAKRSWGILNGCLMDGTRLNIQSHAKIGSIEHIFLGLEFIVVYFLFNLCEVHRQHYSFVPISSMAAGIQILNKGIW